MSSKKHLSQVNNVLIGSFNSVTSSITEPEYNNEFIDKSKDFENELKFKDIELLIRSKFKRSLLNQMISKVK
jgi:hypothetical protein